MSRLDFQRYRGFDFKEFGRELMASVSRDQTLDVAAQLAFWSVFALFPFAIFLLTVIGYIPMPGLEQQLMDFVYQALPLDTAKMVDSTVHEVLGKQRGGLLVVSILGAIWTASGGFVAAMVALNRAYDVQETRPYWRTKGMAMLLTVASAALIIISVAALMVGPDLMRDILGRVGLVGAFDRVWAVIRFPIVIACMMFTLACVYYFLPNVKQRFRIISPGAVVAVLLWIVSCLGFNLYVSNFDSYATTYGTLATPIVLMMWLYLSGIVLMLGGEINAILDRMIKGIRHTERFRGPVTTPDRGKESGEKPVDPQAA